jgi:uncharacterized oligopeptide transporter (OPT) family protein
LLVLPLPYIISKIAKLPIGYSILFGIIEGIVMLLGCIIAFNLVG